MVKEMKKTEGKQKEMTKIFILSSILVLVSLPFITYSLFCEFTFLLMIATGTAYLGIVIAFEVLYFTPNLYENLGGR